jgi:phage-related protein
MAGTVGTALVDTELDPSGIRSGLRKVEQETKSGMSRVGADLKSGFEKAFRPALIGFAAVAAGAGLAIKAASDLNEQVNKASVVFGKSAPAIVAWSQTTAKSLGISQRAALEAAGTFGNMLVPMGIARDRAAEMSKRMVTLAADMASFNNASPEETLQAIRSGLAGETEPLRKFGVFLSEARVKQEALNLGLIKGAGALEAAQARVKVATADVAAATRARTAAQADVVAASKRVAAADAAIATTAKAVASAQERVRDTNERLADTEDRAAEAKRRVRDAAKALTAAQQTARAAQISLTEARKRATDQLINLREAASDAGRGEERASITLARARERLAKVSDDTSSTELDRREAVLSVAEAEDGLQDAQKKRSDTGKELADAERRGVAGSQAVLDARKQIKAAELAARNASQNLAAAKRKEADAQDSVRDAIRGATKAQNGLRDAQQSSRGATIAFRDSQRELAAAQKRASESAGVLVTAQARLKDAQDAAKKAGVGVSKTLTAQQKAQATYSLILKDTKDQQGDFARTSDSVANTQRRITAQTEDATAKLGKGLIPAYGKLQRAQEAVVSWGGKNTKTVQALVGVFAALTGTIIAVNLGMKAYQAGVALVRFATAAWTAVQWLLNASFAPLLLIPVAILAIGIALVVLYKKSEKFRDIVNGTFEELTKVATEFADFFTKELPDAFDAVLSWVDKYWPAIAALVAGPFAPIVLLATDAFGIRSALIEALQGMIDGVKKLGSKISDAGKELGDKLKKGVVDTVSGIGNAVWNVVAGIWTAISSKLSTIKGWGASVGTWIRDAAVSAIKGIGDGAWGIVNNIWTAISSKLDEIKGWGHAVGRWIRTAAIDSIKGIGDGAWDLVNNIWTVLSKKIDEIKGWGKAVGTWIKQGIVNGLKGLGNMIVKLLKKALPGPAEKALGIGRAAPPAGPAAAGPLAAGAGVAATAAGGAGGLAGPVPLGAQLRRALSGLEPSAAAAPTFEVRVFIGDQELTAIVRTEVRQQDNRTAQTLIAGAIA